MSITDSVGAEGQVESVSMDMLVARMRARLLYGDRSQLMMVAEGEAGCGKSEIMVNALTEIVGAPPVNMPGFGAQQVEDILPVPHPVTDPKTGEVRLEQLVSEMLLPTEQMAKDPKYNKHGRPIIPLFIDEVFTGNLGQQNQLRALLTFGRVGSAKIPDCVYFFGTTNPEDAIYSTRKSVDAAVMDRIEIVPVHMEWKEHNRYLSSLENEGRYPEVCRLFLCMEENRDIWKLASPRFWHIKFGNSWHELSQDKSLNDRDKHILFKNILAGHFAQLAKNSVMRRDKKADKLNADALISRFHNFIKHGDDPRWYPISGNRILSQADDKKATEDHLKLFEYWNKENKNNFIGVTIQDLQMTLSEAEEELTDDQVKHVSKVLEASDATALVCQLCQNVFAANEAMYEQIEAGLSKTSVYGEVSATIAESDKMSRELREQKKARAKEQKRKKSMDV